MRSRVRDRLSSYGVSCLFVRVSGVSMGLFVILVSGVIGLLLGGVVEVVVIFCRVVFVVLVCMVMEYVIMMWFFLVRLLV